MGFSVRGAFHCLAITDRIVANPPAFGVALAHVWPSAVPGTDSVPGTVAAALDAIGLFLADSFRGRV